jgi:hypothetical protein
MPTGGHDTNEYYTQELPRPSPNTPSNITPYLGLRSRLSQVWINRWTILLLLVLARTLIAISGINSDLDSARREALSACTGVESMGSAMASMPHYMSQGINEMAATGVEKAVHGLSDMTLLTVTGVEEIFVFYINALTSTYMCLITLAVGGGLHLAISGIEDVGVTLATDLQQLTGSIKSSVSDFESNFNSWINDLGNGLTALTGENLPPPTLDLSKQMDSLAQVKLSSDMASIFPTLNKINSSIPTFQDVQNFTDNVLRTPFELVKTEISTHLANYTFNRSVFPVPAKEQLTFCSDDDGINSFFDELVKLTALAKKVFIATLLLAAILVMIPMGYREIRRYRTMQERAALVQSNAHDPMDVVYIVSRPYTATAGIKVAHTVSSATRRQTLTRWVFAYATSDAALFVLALAIAGLFSVACQAILLKAVEKEVPNLSNQVGGFADKVIATLNNASESWAVGTNGAIADTNDDINQKLLGWVNTTTSAIDDMLDAFINETTSVLNTTFGGTPLYGPITGVFECLIGLKVASIEKGLAWVSDNAQISLPTLPNNTFSLGAVASIAAGDDPDESFLSQPGDDASNQISAAVVRFTQRLEEAVHTEAIVATVILCVYLFVVLCGIVRAIFLWCGRDKVRGEGGPASAIQMTDSFRQDPDMHVDSREGFDDIPLGTVGNKQRPFTPAPKYEPPRHDDEKLRGLGVMSHGSTSPFGNEYDTKNRL